MTVFERLSEAPMGEWFWLLALVAAIAPFLWDKAGAKAFNRCDIGCEGD
jgi:hypothetical protein